MAYPQIRASVPSSITQTNGSSIVCTHPTGLTSGDTMLLFIGFFNSGAARTITTPSGWTSIQNLENSRRRMAAFKKVADSADVSAGSTTVSFSGSVDDGRAYAMYAITGAASGSEITLSEIDSITSSQSAPTATTAITPAVPESLAIMAAFFQYSGTSAALSASAYSLTPSISLTERVDIVDGTTAGVAFMSTTGNYAGTTEITSRSITLSETATVSSFNILVLVNAPVSASASNALLQTTPEFFSPLTRSTQSVNNEFIEYEAELFNAGIMEINPTTWTPIDKS